MRITSTEDSPNRQMMFLVTAFCILHLIGIEARLLRGLQDDFASRSNVNNAEKYPPTQKRKFADWYYRDNCPEDFVKSPSGCCIKPSLLCDRYEDCDDGYDEQLELCKRQECGEGKIRCLEGSRAGACFHKQQLCDGIDDCGGRYDEDTERCLGIPCNDGEVKCGTGQIGRCLPRHQFCDGFPHCGYGMDGSKFDETPSLCLKIPCHLESQFMCPEGSGMPGHCIFRHQLCDGRDNCGGGADEVFKTCLATPCEQGKSPCGDGGCYLDLFRCNGRKDCQNGADEDPYMCGYTV